MGDGRCSLSGAETAYVLQYICVTRATVEVFIDDVFFFCSEGGDMSSPCLPGPKNREIEKSKSKGKPVNNPILELYPVGYPFDNGYPDVFRSTVLSVPLSV